MPSRPSAAAARPPAAAARRAARLADTGKQAPVRRQRPRMTGRMMVFVLISVMLLMSFASSLKAYLRQRGDLDAIQAQITSSQASVNALQAQIDRWNDPAYVREQARQRFGFVMPGQIAYTALDANGNKIDAPASLGNPATVGMPQAPTAWWTTVWGSVQTAGHPAATTGPQALIKE